MAARRKSATTSKRGGSKPPLGTGQRFKKLTSELAKRGAKNPKALAAWIGRKKYGKERFQELSANGKKRSRRGG